MESYERIEKKSNVNDEEWEISIPETDLFLPTAKEFSWKILSMKRNKISESFTEIHCFDKVGA